MGIQDVECRTLSSLRSAKQNAINLADLVSELSRRSSKPLIIMGHSKACLELLFAIHRGPEIFARSVHRVVCVQPPFMGSEMINLLGIKAVAKLWPGLACLAPGSFAKAFTEGLSLEARSYIEQRVLIIKGHRREPRDVSWIIRPSSLFLGRTGESNDGLLRLRDQALPNIICEELTMEMDHSDLFTSQRLSTRSGDFRRIAMKELINRCLDEEVALPLASYS
jgi:hypothetical protein